MRKLLLFFFVAVFLVSVVNAEQSIGSAQQGSCISLTQSCSNCTFVNITSIIYPNKTIQVLDKTMTKTGTNYNYTFCATSKVGEYFYNTLGDPDGVLDTEPVTFTITTSGNNQINSGEGMTLIGSLVVLIIIGIFFFVLGVKAEAVGKIIFITLSAIMLIIALLFSLVAMQQVLGGFDNIVESYSAVWFVLKIVFGVFLLGLTILSGFYAYKLWLKKRGFRD